MFRLFDADGDGRISKEELSNAFGSGGLASEDNESLWRDIMSQVDTDNDGFIDESEFKNCMLEVISKRATFYKPADRD